MDIRDRAWENGVKMEVVRAALDEFARTQHVSVLGGLVHRFRDVELAEEALQDALTAALTSWARDGVPPSPAGWIVTTARRRAIDRLRRAHTGDQAVNAWAEGRSGSAPNYTTEAQAEADELRLYFLCCHPALPQPSQIALTLKLLAGLETQAIASALLTTETAVAQRLVRAKRKIREAGIPLRVPEGELLDDRLPGVLAVAYLVFTLGHTAADGQNYMRPELCREAIRLMRALNRLLPCRAEPEGLLALMLLHDARRAARLSMEGDLVLLAGQDRSQWNIEQIREGQELLERALRRATPGPYQIEAAIAALHAEAVSASSTDWPQVAALYATLRKWKDTPVVRLNQAVAISFTQGPDAGLRLVDQIAAGDDLADYSYLHTARAQLLLRLGQSQRAAEAFRRALATTAAPAERRFLEQCLSDLTAD